ncbi:MAG TPA: sigma-70 family RNA polymerase sigma factor [Planctomycetota bacterium]|nr:sigma-70 family RNA polymerase sigma factor [Planctomycetota bacterium]
MNSEPETRNSELIDRLIEENAGLVRWVVRRLGAREDRLLSFDDHVAAGLVGLWQAAVRFDPARDVQFGTFAHWHIRHAVISNIRDVWHTRRPIACREPAVMISLDAPAGRSGGGPAVSVGSLIPAPQSDVTYPGCRLDLAAAIRRLPEQERLVVIRSYIDGDRLRECLPARARLRKILA